MTVPSEQVAQVAAPSPDDVDLISVGKLLDDVASAVLNTAHTMSSGTDPRDMQIAFYQLAAVFGQAAKAFGHVQIAIPKEQQ